MEYNAIKLLIKLLDEDKTPAAPGFTLHVAHLANAEALPMIEAARKKGAFLFGCALPLAEGNTYRQQQSALQCKERTFSAIHIRRSLQGLGKSGDRVRSCALSFDEVRLHVCRLAHKCGDMHALPDLCSRGRA